MNMFHRIRNAISHGRFRLNGDYFFFEDVDTAGRIVKARICLKIATMENWMRIIKCEDEDAKRVQDDMKMNRAYKQRKAFQQKCSKELIGNYTNPSNY